MTGALLQAVAVCAAFWIALGVTCACERDPALRTRALLGLVLGAVFAHAGWMLVHWEHWTAARTLSDALAGTSVLFVPFGLLAAAPGWNEPARSRYLHVSFLGLPLALAAARFGCVLRGCCLGTPTSSAASFVPLHPTAGYEIAGLLALFALVRAVPPASTAPVVLAGIGLLRLLLEPLRAEGPVHPSFPVEGVALALVATGAAMAWGPTALGTLHRRA